MEQSIEGRAGNRPAAARLHEDVVDTETLHKVAVGAVAGTVIEWFDFAIYGFLAPYLAAVFFPGKDPLIGILQTFAVFAIAFALRPFGGAFFGMLGDRIGRKRVLALTVTMMTVGTAAIGLIPSYASIGVLAAILLTLARCIQGFSAGGEYAAPARSLSSTVRRTSGLAMPA